MNNNLENQIETAEERLRLAMLTSDIESLNALISPRLIFTTHFGAVISKQEDLEIHRSGALKFKTIEPLDRKMLMLGNVAYVSVYVRTSGIFNGLPFQDDIRFSRVWELSPNNTWQVVAGQATIVQTQ